MISNQVNLQGLTIGDDEVISVGNELDISRLINTACPSIDAKITTDGVNLTFSSDFFSTDYSHYANGLTNIEYINNGAVPTIKDNV